PEAIRGLKGSRNAWNSLPRLFRWEAEQWLENRNRGPLFSFENICSTLYLDANSLRGQIRRWRARQDHKSTPRSSRSLRVGERNPVLPGGVPALSSSSRRRRRLQFAAVRLPLERHPPG